MPNNPAAPVDDASYAAKEDLLARQNLPVDFTLYAGIGPGTRPLTRTVPYKAYMGPSVGDLFFSSAWRTSTIRWRTTEARPSAFTAKIRSCWTSTSRPPTHEARRPPECELSATRFALAMIEKYGLTGKLCHYSVGEGLPLIRAAKAKGLAVTAEVTPHHVFFDTAQITDGESALDADEPAAARARRPGSHAGSACATARPITWPPITPRTRSRRRHSGMSGQPHLDTYGPFVTWLLVEQGFTPERIAAICSANPGAFVNPYRRQKYGRLLPGYVGSLTRAGFETADHHAARGSADEVRLEPV